MIRAAITTRPVYRRRHAWWQRQGSAARIKVPEPHTVHVSAIIAAGGRGLRFGGRHPKQLLTLGGRSILQRSLDVFLRCDLIADVVVALPAEMLADAPSYLQGDRTRFEVVAGGPTRRDSVAHAFARVADRADVVVIHDAARPLVTDVVIRRTVARAGEVGAAIAALRVHDTVKQVEAGGRVMQTLPRDGIYLAQTPQAFRTEILRAALALDGEATDEAALAERAGYRVDVVEGDPRNLKVTTPSDLALAEHLLGGAARVSSLRIGNGYDLHRLVPGRPLVLGGVTIPFEKGLQGHSDADAVCHAVTDAVLGAAAAGDIGRLFPDNDPQWEGADSLELLRRAVAVIAGQAYTVVNVDVVVIAQQPKLVPHLDQIRANLAAALGCASTQVSVKGKTNEGVDSMGAGESIAVHAVALLMEAGVVS
jgi:2-C-methyl-D-erythritol 4-phosphate cytidylyltransferase/2-C-methyl-D-erythritol 2,4-cyclodiphosphate synthase